MKALNVRQRRFVEEYMVDGNGARAAARAGYSADRADSQASVLLKRPQVAAALAEARAARVARMELGADAVLEQLVAVATTDFSEAADWGERDGKPFYEARPLESLPPRVRRAIARVTPTAYGPRVELYDKMAALGALARRLGMLVERPGAAEPEAEAEPPVSERMARLPREARERVRALMLEAQAVEREALAGLGEGGE